MPWPISAALGSSDAYSSSSLNIPMSLPAHRPPAGRRRGRRASAAMLRPPFRCRRASKSRWCRCGGAFIAEAPLRKIGTIRAGRAPHKSGLANRSAILAECSGYNAPLRQLSSPPAAVSSDAPPPALACDWRPATGDRPIAFSKVIMSFASLGLSDALVRAVTEHGYTQPTPIQQQAIPAVLAGGDLLAGAQTGTGKTAGFVLPMLQRLALAHTASGAGAAQRQEADPRADPHAHARARRAGRGERARLRQVREARRRW